MKWVKCLKAKLEVKSTQKYLVRIAAFGCCLFLLCGNHPWLHPLWLSLCPIHAPSTNTHTPTLRCLSPASAVESTRQGRTSTRQKPCSLRNGTPALLRCTPASLAVRHTHSDTQLHKPLYTSWQVLMYPSVSVFVLLVSLCVAGDKKMMVPSSTAGGQQLYSQSSPFQQGHSGKSFRYMSVMNVRAGKAQEVPWGTSPSLKFHALFVWFCTQFLCDPCPQREWHPAVRLIQSESFSDHQTAQPRPSSMVRQPAPFLWTGNTVRKKHTHTKKGFVSKPVTSA